LLEHDTAGDPMTGLRWSRRSTTRIAEALFPLGISVSPNTIARLLNQMGYSLRVNHKQISTSSSPNRNLQFTHRRSGTISSFFRVDLCRRLGRIPEGRASYEKALAPARQEPERRFLARRLEELK
jgi:Rhodopirellula transposase DDE domain